MYPGLQPYAAQPATLRGPPCNPTWPPCNPTSVQAALFELHNAQMDGAAKQLL